MNYDIITFNYNKSFKETEVFTDAIQNKNLVKNAFKEISRWKKNLINEANYIYADNNITADDIFDLIEAENEHREQNGDALIEPLTTFSKSEEKRRNTLSKKAMKISSEGAGRYFAKCMAFDLAGIEGCGRSTSASVISLSKDENETYTIANKIAHIEEGNNRKEVREFMLNGFEKAKRTLDKISQIKSDEELVDFMSKNFDIFQFYAEMQGHNMELLNNELKLGISKDYIDDWRTNYSSYAVDATILRSKLLSMANPLYSKIDPDEISKINGYNFKYMDSSFMSKEDNREVGEMYFNPLDDYGSHAGLMQTPKYLKNVSQQEYENLEQQSNFLKDSICYKLHRSSLDSDIKKYEFINSRGETVDQEKALKDIALGETYSLMKDDTFVMKLESQKGAPTGILGYTNDITYFDLKETFNKNQSQDEKLFDDLKNARETLKNETDPKRKAKLEKNVNKLENKIQSAKNKAIENTTKKFNSTIKELYAKVKSHNPWYIRRKNGNRTYTLVQTNLDRLLTGKNLSVKDRKDLAVQTRRVAETYLTNRANNPNRKMNKNALLREEAMLQVLNSLQPIEKELEVYTTEVKKYDDILTPVDLKVQKDLVQKIEIDLEKDAEVITVDKIKGKNLEKSKELFNKQDELNEKGLEEDKLNISVEQEEIVNEL